MIIIKQEAFLPSTPSKVARLQSGHRRRRSDLPGEFTPMARSGRRAESDPGSPVNNALTTNQKKKHENNS
jgi:hypothetical protein